VRRLSQHTAAAVTSGAMTSCSLIPSRRTSLLAARASPKVMRPIGRKASPARNAE